MPLDIPIDELVTWNQLLGDRRLSDALAECDTRGWDALPLASKELTRLPRFSACPSEELDPAGTNNSMNVRLTEAEIHAVSTACRTAVSSHR